MLTLTDHSLLVVDRLCDRTTPQNTTVKCFYFDFAAQKEQTATSMLGSLLKQIFGGTRRIQEDICGHCERNEMRFVDANRRSVIL